MNENEFFSIKQRYFVASKLRRRINELKITVLKWSRIQYETPSDSGNRFLLHIKDKLHKLKLLFKRL